MTIEELSSATADRYEKRMIGDVQKTTNFVRPPRMEPPNFSRQNLERDVSARATVPDEDSFITKEDGTTKAVTTPVNHLYEFTQAFKAIEPNLVNMISDDDRTRIIRSLYSPDSTITPYLHSHPETCILVASMLAFGIGIMCTSTNQSRDRNYTGDSPSATTYAASRLVSTINRPR